MPPGRNSAAWLRVAVAIAEKAADTKRPTAASDPGRELANARHIESCSVSPRRQLLLARLTFTAACTCL
eukprot:6196962-Pleurochrysis_carterae.AAC.4